MAGGLIDSLNFTIVGAAMGQTLSVGKGEEITISILVRDWKSEVDHIDIIAGYVNNLIAPSEPEYRSEKAPRTKVIARFGTNAGEKCSDKLITQLWRKESGNVKSVTMKLKATENMYFRIRGTNHAINTSGETDGAGNPLPDPFEKNDKKAALADLWFYSNPVFVKIK